MNLEGTRERIVELGANHNDVARFGKTPKDLDNLSKVLSNVEDLYKHALDVGKLGELSYSTAQPGESVRERTLEERLDALRS